jgi:hypothetical protein
MYATYCGLHARMSEVTGLCPVTSDILACSPQYSTLMHAECHETVMQTWWKHYIPMHTCIQSDPIERTKPSHLAWSLTYVTLVIVMSTHVNISKRPRTGPILSRCCQHRSRIAPVLGRFGMFSWNATQVNAWHVSLYCGHFNILW